MIVILEGPNRCGKTTLAKHLIKNYGFAYFKDVRIENRKLTNKQKKSVIEHDIEAQAVLLKAISNDINLIVDRFHVTEYVYGKLNRKYDSNSISIAEDILKDSNTKMIFLVKSTEDFTNKLLKKYCDAIQDTQIETLVYDIKVSRIEYLNKFLGLDYTEEIKMDEGKCTI